MRELSPIGDAKKKISMLFFDLQNDVNNHMSVDYESSRIYNNLRDWHLDRCKYPKADYAQKGIDAIDVVLKSTTHKEIKTNLFDAYVIIHGIAAIGELNFE